METERFLFVAFVAFAAFAVKIILLFSPVRNPRVLESNLAVVLPRQISLVPVFGNFCELVVSVAHDESDESLSSSRWIRKFSA
jgi:hypothetical protein